MLMFSLDRKNNSLTEKKSACVNADATMATITEM